jgi:hypothetical protein
MARVFELVFIAIFCYLVFQRVILPLIKGYFSIKSVLNNQQRAQPSRPQNPPSESKRERIDKSQVKDAEFKDIR